MGQKFTQVDAFTAHPFAGNPAAVCVMDGPADEDWMQSVAMEMNLSETAFLHPEADGYRLRWFTPTTEVNICGHATLASAHVLWEEGYLSPGQQARFQTLSGLLTADQRDGLIELDFPSKPEQAAEPPEGLLEALGVEASYVGRNELDYLVEVDGESVVRNLAPDFTKLRAVKMRGVIVTSRAEADEYDFVSRFFAPGSGVGEDPVTGSTHSCLAPYWGAKLGKQELRAYQASARGGHLTLRLVDNRVKIAGQAVTVLRGELAI